MPTRLFRDGILKSKRVDALSSGGTAFEFYVRLLLVVDDYGRIEYNPNVLLSECFPTRPGRYTVDQLDAWIAECAAVSEEWDEPLIFTYRIRRKTYIQCNDTRQRIRGASKCPAPPGVVDPVFEGGKLVREGYAGEPPVPPLFAAMAETPSSHSAAPPDSPQSDVPNAGDELSRSEAEAWASKIYNSHPKQTSRKESIETLIRRFSRDGPSRTVFERNHALWLLTEEWRKKNGVFCPPLARRDGSGWIEDGGWRSPPGEIRGKPPEREVCAQEKEPATPDELRSYIAMAEEFAAACRTKGDAAGETRWLQVKSERELELAQAEERRKCA